MRPPREPSAFVAYHGTIARRLGLDVMLRAVRQVIDSGQPLRAAIWGDGDAVKELLQLREALGLAESVDLTGQRVPLERLIERLASVGIGIVSLRRDVSTDIMLPTKLIEYVRLGIPVIVTWTPTIARYFPEDTVVYIREFTARRLAQAIMRVLANPSGAREMASRAQELSIARGWRDLEQEYVEMVKESGLEEQR
jgi:glycosyltransferase involved in cell wall biosynthesis